MYHYTTDVCYVYVRTGALPYEQVGVQLDQINQYKVITHLGYNKSSDPTLSVVYGS